MIHPIILLDTTPICDIIKFCEQYNMEVHICSDGTCVLVNKGGVDK